MTGTTTAGQSGHESHANEGYFQIFKAPELEPHHQIVLCYIQDIYLRGGSLNQLKRCSRRILFSKTAYETILFSFKIKS